MRVSAPQAPAGAAWSSAERADSAVCASVLATGAWWWGWMLACGALAAVVAWSRHDLWVGVALCVGGVPGTWWVVRVNLDARLFQWMAQAEGPLTQGRDLDAALKRVVGRSTGVDDVASSRSMAERVAGAMGLYRRLVAWSLLHGGVAIAYLLMVHGSGTQS